MKIQRKQIIAGVLLAALLLSPSAYAKDADTPAPEQADRVEALLAYFRQRTEKKEASTNSEPDGKDSVEAEEAEDSGKESEENQEEASEPEEKPAEIAATTLQPMQEKKPPANALTASNILAKANLIAHGMGSVTERTATLNCLEGFLTYYEAGTRVFEVDLRLTRDGKVVLRHDWWPTDWQEDINWISIPTREKFLSEPILKQYTPLSFQDLLLLMEAFPDICIITDTKFTDSDVFFLQFDAMLADAKELGLSYLFDRIVVQVYSGNMRYALESIYPFPNYIYTLYAEGFGKTEAAFREKAAYCAEKGILGITMPDFWWSPAYAAIAKEYGVKVFVHTVNDVEEAKKFLAEGVDGVYTDRLISSDFS